MSKALKFSYSRVTDAIKHFPDKLHAPVAPDLLSIEGHEDDGVLVPEALGPDQS